MTFTSQHNTCPQSNNHHGVSLQGTCVAVIPADGAFLQNSRVFVYFFSSPLGLGGNDELCVGEDGELHIVHRSASSRFWRKGERCRASRTEYARWNRLETVSVAVERGRQNLMREAKNSICVAFFLRPQHDPPGMYVYIYSIFSRDIHRLAIMRLRQCVGATNYKKQDFFLTFMTVRHLICQEDGWERQEK